MVNHLSSLQRKPFRDFLPERLRGALDYKRIAGYFSSSILDIAGEEIESMEGTVSVIANTEIAHEDLAASKGEALRTEFYEATGRGVPSEHVQKRLLKLQQLIASGKLDIRLVGSDKFGLIHGKGGVITRADGSKTAFIGSANDTWNAWAINYEMVWEDDSEEAVRWFEEEFETLSKYAQPLPDWVIKEIKRLGSTVVIGLDEWDKSGAKPDSALTPFPLYRQEGGLRPYQEWFVERIYARYLECPKDARAILADEVGLGKTVSLALSAALITLKSNKPCLILCPKTLTEQWQVEMADKLALPSARWNGKLWITENGEEIPSPIGKCPRKIGIVSQGLITRNSEETIEEIASLSYGCIIVDEAHRARKRPKSGMNNLMAFMHKISDRTEAFLLGTATPVQLDPIEAYQLLEALNAGHPSVLGTSFSRWNAKPLDGLDVVRGTLRPANFRDEWEWLRNPLPSAVEEDTFKTIRGDLGLRPQEVQALAESWEDVGLRARGMVGDYNPYLIRIIQRTRLALEERGLLPKIRVESKDVAIPLSDPLVEAFDLCSQFCRSVGKMSGGSGFLETMLARRIGSSITAGLNTVKKLLGESVDDDDDGEEDDDEETAPVPLSRLAARLDAGQRGLLVQMRDLLKTRTGQDEKRNYCLKRIAECRGEGILLFSQYFDTIEAFAPKDMSEPIAIYAGGTKSCIWENGRKTFATRDEIKQRIRKKEIRILFGTDAAAEGLNLQTLRHMVNIDCPWNPTKMEQRLGRIRRIGQIHDSVTVHNLRYAGSVEERVHVRLSQRSKDIHALLGTYPESFRDAWIEEARGNSEKASELINAPVPDCSFLRRAEQTFEDASWGYAAEVLNPLETERSLRLGW
jgi:superfamily II DNA or RNA helicase